MIKRRQGIKNSNENCDLFLLLSRKECFYLNQHNSKTNWATDARYDSNGGYFEGLSKCHEFLSVWSQFKESKYD